MQLRLQQLPVPHLLPQRKAELTLLRFACLYITKVENVKTLRYAMGVFDQTDLDFVDCLLVAYKKVLGLDVLSFDKKLNSAITRGFEIFQT